MCHHCSLVHAFMCWCAGTCMVLKQKFLGYVLLAFGIPLSAAMKMKIDFWYQVFFIIRVPEIRLSPMAVLKEQWFSWCGCNFHSLYWSFGNHTCFYFKWMATFVARMWNCEFLMKKLQMIKIYFRHSLPRSTHWKLYRWWLQNWPLFNACEKSLEGGLLSEWQECGPPSHPTHNVRFNRPWNKHKNICF